jgi:plastocyanin
MKLKIIMSAAIGLLIATGTVANAAEVVVTQKAKKFDQKKVTISKGDTIKFVNSDAMTHNIHSRGAGKFDLEARHDHGACLCR